MARFLPYWLPLEDVETLENLGTKGIKDNIS